MEIVKWYHATFYPGAIYAFIIYGLCAGGAIVGAFVADRIEKGTWGPTFWSGPSKADWIK